jgi:mandelate racemase
MRWGVHVTDALHIHHVQGRLVRVPMTRPLGTSAAVVTHAFLLLVDLQVDGGPVGRSYIFCYGEAPGRAAAEWLRRLAPELQGQMAAPRNLAQWLAPRMRLVGHRGLASMVTAALDIAAWDALSHACGASLARLLGASPAPIRAYNSNGLGLIEPEVAASEAEELLQGGFSGVKMRLGRPTLEKDLEAVRAVRRILPPQAHLMADFNQALSPAEAVRRCCALDDEGLSWIEEPVRHDDYATYALLRTKLRTPLHIGENFQSTHAMAQALTLRCCDYVMVDVERIGGVTGWIGAAALAEVHDVELSSHLMPEVSAQLLAASPTRQWLEYVDWANPILKRPLQIRNGFSVPHEGHGTGVEWNEDAVRAFLVE